MPWRRKSPEHQQPWYWLCRIGKFWSYLGKDFNYFYQVSVEKWYKLEIHFYVSFEKFNLACEGLTHWGRVTLICVSKQTIIGSDNGLSPGWRQVIIWTNAGILLIGTLGTNFSEILIEIGIFSFKKMGLKVSSAKRRPFCLGLNVVSEKSRPDQDTIFIHAKADGHKW